MVKDTIRKARPSDASHIRKLIEYYASRDQMLARSLSYIYEHIRDFTVYVRGGKIIGCCALYVTWRDLAEIKSLAVDPNYVKQGIGSKLLKACLNEAKALGVPRVFTLTVAPVFFTKNGFKKTPKNRLPMKIWGECINCNKYPECDETALIYNT